MLKSFSSGVAAVAFAAFVAVPMALAEAQESKSAPLARQLTQLLEASKLQTIGAVDPSGGFVAALHVPGAQLLVVAGKFPSIEMGTYRMEKKEYRELYMDLMGGAVAGSRLVASDIGGDGFVAKAKRDVPPDTWERDMKTLAFEGSRKAKLTDELYDKAYNAADAEYARILELLLTQVKPKGTS